MPGNSNSGRRCDWFREECQRIIQDEKLLDFVARVACGKEVTRKIVEDGGVKRTVEVVSDLNTRLAAFKMLAEWGVGKPIQYVMQPSRSPEESVKTVQQMLDLVKAASARPPIVVPDAAAAKSAGEGNGNGKL